MEIDTDACSHDTKYSLACLTSTLAEATLDDEPTLEEKVDAIGVVSETIYDLIEFCAGLPTNAESAFTSLRGESTGVSVYEMLKGTC